MTEVLGLIKYKGWAGAGLPIFAASAWKLFHRATILLGTHGASTLSVSAARVASVAVGESNISPAYSRTRPASWAPKPARPVADRKRTQLVNGWTPGCGVGPPPRHR